MNRIQSAVLTLLVSFTFSIPVFAQSAREAQEAPRTTGVTLEQFTDEIQTAASSAGIEAPSAQQARELFAAADANGDGQIDEREAQNGAARPSCGDRGVCIRGACYCASGSAHREGSEGGLLEAEEAQTVTNDNPLFNDGGGASTNIVAE